MLAKETRTVIGDAAKPVSDAQTLAEKAQPASKHSPQTLREKGPCVQSLAPHIKELVRSGFRIGQQKPSDSGHKGYRGRKRSRKKTSRKHKQKESHVTIEHGALEQEDVQDRGNGGQENIHPTPPQGVQPKTAMRFVMAHGKKNLERTGRFLYFAAAAAVGMTVMTKVSSWWAGRAAAKAAAAAAPAVD